MRWWLAYAIFLFLIQLLVCHMYNRPLPSSYGFIKRPLHVTEDIDVVSDKPKVNNNVRVTWKAEKQSSVRVTESLRTCEEYMALPATEYSVLSANQIIRLSDTSFKAILPTLNFFGTKITPVLYVRTLSHFLISFCTYINLTSCSLFIYSLKVDVIVYPELAKSEIIVVKAETIGSDVASMINGTFNISAVNTVLSSSTTEETRNKKQVIKKLNSHTTLQIDVVVPENTKVKIPSNLLQSSGSFIIQSSLNVIVPTFVRILAADFKRWSSGTHSCT